MTKSEKKDWCCVYNTTQCNVCTTLCGYTQNVVPVSLYLSSNTYSDTRTKLKTKIVHSSSRSRIFKKEEENLYL